MIFALNSCMNMPQHMVINSIKSHSDSWMDYHILLVLVSEQHIIDEPYLPYFGSYECYHWGVGAIVVQ